MVCLITGGGGFIGSNLAETLVARGETIRVLDNFSTGIRRNLVFPGAERMEIIEGDIRDFNVCRTVLKGVDIVFHQAALGSISRSVDDPRTSNEVNVSGTLNLLVASREARVRRFVFASSSSIYGDMAGSTQETIRAKKEEMQPAPLAPYGVGKLAAETYCGVFHRIYGLETVMLRYFNVFGPRQNHLSDYAAAVPRFIMALMEGRRPVIYGDGEQSRSFTFVCDVVHANLLAATVPGIGGEVFNIAGRRRFSILELFRAVREIAGSALEPRFAEAKQGDVRHSRASIRRARDRMGFEPAWSFRQGLEVTVDWYRTQLSGC
jgi:nucleoside-diphosphate-sugar epimerase